MSDFLKQDEKISTSDLTHRIFRKYDTSEDSVTGKYIVATQVRSKGSNTEATADAVVIGNWPSSGYEIAGFEVKISRSDWLNEVKNPNKHTYIGKYCHRFWLVISSSTFVKDGELPENWGMMVAQGTGLRIVKQAPLLTPTPPTVEFITGLMRANKRETISEDLHKQYLNDAKLDIERRLKSEYSELKEYVKSINEAFGIELIQEKSYDYRTGKDNRNWTAKVRGKYKKYSPDELKQLIESVLSGDMDDAMNKLSNALTHIEDASETLSRYKGLKKW